MRRAGVGLEVGETGADAGGGFAVEVACCCCHAYCLNNNGRDPLKGYRLMSFDLDAQSRLPSIRKCSGVPSVFRANSSRAYSLSDTSQCYKFHREEVLLNLHSDFLIKRQSSFSLGPS